MGDRHRAGFDGRELLQGEKDRHDGQDSTDTQYA